MAFLSNSGIPLDKLRTLLKDIGHHFPEHVRNDLTQEVLALEAREVGGDMQARFYDPSTGAISQSIHHAFSFHNGGMDAAHDQTFGGFAKQYCEAADACKEVLTFLQAQDNMDLFQGNEKAKNVYRAIVLAGINEVLYNNRRWAR